jgi:diguanylate cyclase (GGDEF)-like protein/PAS domain S-box-containing protein
MLTGLGRIRDWPLANIAGVAAIFATVIVMKVAGASAVLVFTAVVGATIGFFIAGAVAAWRFRQTMRDENFRLDAALNNMNQGLCMFDAESRLVVWNERYTKMYSIDPKRIWIGCTVRDLLDARIAAGTFPLDPGRYDTDLRLALREGKAFTMNIELGDGRMVAVVNQPSEGGGWVATHEDITERKRAERELDQTRQFLDTIIENVPSPIIVKDAPSLRYRLINRAAERFLGVGRDSLLGKTSSEVIPKPTAQAVEAEDRKLIERGEMIFVDQHVTTTPGNGPRVATSTRLPVKGPDGKTQYLISVINDLTEQKRREQRIAHMAHHDLLTDLPNRAAFNECLAATIDLAKPSGDSFALLCIDLDRFKEVNDVYGHPVGDALLREVATRLAGACPSAFVARLGGDEFSIVTPTGPQPSTAEVVAERLQAALDSDIDIDGRVIRMGMTIGVAIYPDDGVDAAALNANAGAALHRAKSEARGSVRFFEVSTDKQLREKRVLQQELRNAIARNELILHYQPQALIDREVTGFEALTRWRHPRHGMVPPSTFIPLAEEDRNIMVAFGEWVLRTACREAASWPRPLQIAVNLSPVQFQRGDLPALVHQILLETGLAPARLELEITEGVLIGDFNRALATLRRLKALGVRIAMDDFGTGYSSLSYLQSFPFDKIKIDQAFVANLSHNQQSATIIRAVIALGRGLNLPVFAEGVETKEQLAFLANEACTGVQGYYLGRPQPIELYSDIVGRGPVAAAKTVLAAAS